MSESNGGLDANVKGLLCYLLGWVTGIVFILIEKEDRGVRFHAFQSVAVFGALAVIGMVSGFIPVIGGVVAMLVAPAWLVLWILLMVKAYQGEQYKLPLVGDWAEQQAQA